MAECLRMCVVCKAMKKKNVLLRITKNDDEFLVDISGKLPGRGAYICKDGACKEKFEKLRSFERAFRGPVPQEIKETIKKELIQ